MRISSFFTLLGLCAVSSSLAAQSATDPQSIAAGTHARIISSDDSKDYIKLTVVGASRDSLRYQLNHESETKALAWQQIRRMDMSTGSHGHAMVGVGLGLLGGAAIGAAMGSSGTKGEMRGLAAMGFGILGGVVGGIVGGISGHMWRSENWAPVARPNHPPVALHIK